MRGMAVGRRAGVCSVIVEQLSPFGGVCLDGLAVVSVVKNLRLISTKFRFVGSKVSLGKKCPSSLALKHSVL